MTATWIQGANLLKGVYVRFKDLLLARELVILQSEMTLLSLLKESR
jgi:hypothetical protein